MQKRNHQKSENYFPFRGLFTYGECGCAITAELQKGHNYYRCTKKKNPCSQKYVREELLTEQVKSFLQKVSLSSQDTEKVLRELDKDEHKAKLDNHAILQNFKNEITDIGVKLDKLLSAYLDEIVSADEYAAQKEKLLARKVECAEEINEIANGSVSWLEPARAWVKSLNQADNLVKSENRAEMTTFLKQIGSNHILFDKHISFPAKKPFEMLAERRQNRRDATSFHLQNPDWR